MREYVNDTIITEDLIMEKHILIKTAVRDMKRGAIIAFPSSLYALKKQSPLAREDSGTSGISRNTTLPFTTPSRSAAS